MVTVEMIVSNLATAYPFADNLYSGSVNVHPERAIPDLSTMLLVGFGLAGLGFFRQRKREARPIGHSFRNSRSGGHII